MIIPSITGGSINCISNINPKQHQHRLDGTLSLYKLYKCMSPKQPQPGWPLFQSLQGSALYDCKNFRDRCRSLLPNPWNRGKAPTSDDCHCPRFVVGVRIFFGWEEGMINFCWMRKLFIFQKRRGVRCVVFWVDRIYTQLNKHNHL